MGMKFLRRSEGWRRRERIRSRIFIDEIGVQNLVGLEEKQLQWFGHLKRIHRTRMLRGELELKFKGERYMRWPRTRLFNEVLEDIKKGGKRWQEIKRETW